MDGQPEDVSRPHIPQGLGEGGEEVVELVAEQAHTAITQKKPAMIPSKVFFPRAQPFWLTVCRASTLLGPGVKLVTRA